MQLDAPIQQHRLHVGERPHLYPLARLIDQYPRYGALLADTHSARLFVFGMARTLDKQELQQEKLTRIQTEGWSQMRYQRHIDNYHLHHAKEVVEMLERVVEEERAEHIILAGDEVIIPLLHEKLPESFVNHDGRAAFVQRRQLIHPTKRQPHCRLRGLTAINDAMILIE